MKVPCPRCGQDYVKRAWIKPLAESIIICPECDAFWREGSPIDAQNFADYHTYMESKGCSSCDWNLLEISDEVEECGEGR